MWEKFIAWLNGMDPGVIKTSILAIAGGFTSLIGTLMGEHQNLFYWLFAFVVVDYFTGIFAAAKTGTWSSARGLKGLIRKFLILFIAIGFHGIDQILQEPWIGAWAIGALSINEIISILENIEKAGFESIIPQRIRDMLDVVKEKHEKKIKDKLPGESI
ncbi:phage holin family protein [Turicimonas muris]|uniref:phage holin family protein n=1 Tax=Turicimonas muris TaxID=1796652 RepID=UPI0023F47B1A|nr:phage holin family protein [Turicimonas muris]